MVIYIISNKINNKAYIGRTVKPLQERWQGHLSEARNTRSKQPIHLAMRKHGPENFFIEEIRVPIKNEEEFIRYEGSLAFFLNTYVPHGYNLVAGERNIIGKFKTQEERKAAARERWRRAWLKKLSESGRVPKPRAKLERTKEQIRAAEAKARKEKRKEENKAIFIDRVESVQRKTYSVYEVAGSKMTKEYRLIAPDGSTITFQGFRRFCRDMGLSQTGLRKLFRGEFKVYRGYSLPPDKENSYGL